MCIFTNLD